MIFMLWKLVGEGTRVLFIYTHYKIYYDGKGNVFQFDKLPSLWCLFDCRSKTVNDINELPQNRCNIVLSTSPRRELINGFKKPAVPKMFCMPTWLEMELEQIASAFPESIDWRTRYEALGGIPRSVLENIADDPTLILEEACRHCDLDECIKLVGEDSIIDDKSKVVHSLIHMTSESPNTSSSVCFASKVALGIIVRNKGIIAWKKMTELLASCRRNPLIASLCGYIFEPYAIKMLEKGGTFKYRDLQDGNDFELNIPPSIKIVADKVYPVSQTTIINQLYVPRTSNYTGIDAWMYGVGGFQMTVSEKHNIRQSTANDIKNLDNNFFWLLPPSVYDSFQKTPKSISQIAMLIPFPEE